MAGPSIMNPFVGLVRTVGMSNWVLEQVRAEALRRRARKQLAATVSFGGGFDPIALFPSCDATSGTRRWPPRPKRRMA